jgi:hypothetical protein
MNMISVEKEKSPETILSIGICCSKMIPGDYTGILLKRETYFIFKLMSHATEGSIPGKRVFFGGFNILQNGTWRCFGGTVLISHIGNEHDFSRKRKVLGDYSFNWDMPFKNDPRGL